MKLSSQFHNNIKNKIIKLEDGRFLVKICGDSMINAEINDGDSVLIEESKEFVSGDIVLAYTGKNHIIGRFMSVDEPPYLYLKLENSNYPNILFTDNIEMKGKIISILKNGHWETIR